MSQIHSRFKLKLRWSFLSILILAIGISSLVIVSFNYSRNYQEIQRLAIAQMQIVGHQVVKAISVVTKQATVTAKLIRGIITSEAEITTSNQSLIPYLARLLESIPVLESITIGARNGNLIVMTDLQDSENQESAPPDARYKILFFDRAQMPPKEFLEYRDTSGTILEKKEVHENYLDPRTQSWYQVIAQWPRTHWTSDYSSYTDSILTYLSFPIHAKNLDVVAVANITVSLEYLSNLVSFIRPVESGSIYIINESGQIVLPLGRPSGAQAALVEFAHSRFSESKESTFRMKKDQKEWLVDGTPLPLDYETKWLVMTLVPFDDFFASIIKTQNNIILISIAIALVFSVFSFLLTSRYISNPVEKLAEQSSHLQQLDFNNYEPIHSHISEIITFSSSFNGMYHALSSFARYVPREVVGMLIEQNREIELGGQRGELTILFTDIENFTSTSEMLPIETVLQTLSEYFEIFSKIIVDSAGTIDKYIGDSIMALWNAPRPVADSCSRACLAALRCLKYSSHHKTDNPFLLGRTRFGIHHGDVIFGNIGTRERMCYTAIGNAVNTAERLENLNKQYQTSILISESVLERIGSEFVTRPLDFVYMKGRGKGTTVYELVGLNTGPSELIASAEEVAFCKEFTLAYRQFHEQNMEAALQNFKDLNAKMPSDYATQLYLDRVKAVNSGKS